MRASRSWVLGLIFVTGVLMYLKDGFAHSYPSETIRLLVPSAAGTPPDIITRTIANTIAKTEGWRLMVENKPGAMATIGAMEVLNRTADGYTVMSAAMASTVAPFLLPAAKANVATDFAPVIKIATAYHVLVVHPSVQAKSLGELVALIKREPDKFTFSSGGFGTPAHMAGELFRLQTGARVIHVPYQALPRAIADLINGTNHFQFITPLPVLELIAAGKLRALAVTGPTRLEALPDVPTVVEAGFPSLVVQDWVGYFVKKGTSNEIIRRLNEALNNALRDPTTRASLLKMSAHPAGGTTEEFRAFVESEMIHWGKVISDAGIKMGD